MVHRPADSRLLSNLLQQEKEYSKQLNQVLDSSNVSLASFAAYAAASPPPASHVIMAVTTSLAAADEALRRYARGVEEWRESMRMLKDAEEEVGNIMRDREILVTRMIKASKSPKSGSSNFRESLLLGHQRFPSSSSLSLSFNANQDSPSPPPSRPLSHAFSSSKLAAAQSELQACEAHLAAKERELDAKRCAAVRDGMGARVKAMIECGWAWNQHGKEALRALEDLKLETSASEYQKQEQEYILEPHTDVFQGLKIPETDSARPSSDFSSIGPSQSASQVNVNGEHEHLPPPVHMGSIMNSGLFGDPPLRRFDVDNDENLLQAQAQDNNTSDPRRPPSGSLTTTSSISAIAPATYKVETMTYAPAVALHVAGRDAGVSASASASAPLPVPISTSSELFKGDNDDLSTHRSQSVRIPVPAPHALEGYAFDIPTAEMLTPVAGPSGLRHKRSGSRSRSRSESQTPPVSGRSTPQPIVVGSGVGVGVGVSLGAAPPPVKSSIYTRSHVLERRITEEEVRHSLEHSLELDDARRRRSGSGRNGSVSSTEEDVKNEKKLVREGKLAVVENPRFMTEARRREVEREEEREEERDRKVREKEKERAKAQERKKAQERQGEGHEETPTPTPKKEKKRFSFFHSPSNSQTQAQNARLASTSTSVLPDQQQQQQQQQQAEGHVTFDTTTTTTTPKPPGPGPGAGASPGKGFFGSLKGFFVSKHSAQGTAPSSPSSPSAAYPPTKAKSRNRRALSADSSSSDDDEDRSPTTRSGGLQSLFRGSPSSSKDKERTSSNKWETRTDRNIRQLQQLQRRGSLDDASLGVSRRGGGVGLGAGLAGRAVVNAGVVSASEVGVQQRGRAASDVGHGYGGTASMSPSTSNVGTAGSGSGRRLKKNRAGPPVSQSALGMGTVGGAGAGVSSSESLPIHLTSASAGGGGATGKMPARVASTSAPSGKGKRKAPRSARVDVPARQRKSWADSGEEEEGTSSGGGGGTRRTGMIVDLGRRKRIVSDVGVGVRPGSLGGGGVGVGEKEKGKAVVSPAPARELGSGLKAVPTSTPTTAAAAAAAKKGYSSDTTAAVVTVPVARKKSLTKRKPQAQADTAAAPPAVPSSDPAQPSTSTLPTREPPTRKPSIKSSSVGTGAAAATFISANNENPSGTLVAAQPGWNAHVLGMSSMGGGGGGLSRNSSVVSSASAPSGPGVGRGRGRRETSLGQGVSSGAGAGAGVGRRASLGSSSAVAVAAGRVHSTTTAVPSSAPSSAVGIQPAPPATSLMSIVEDVARSNRQGWSPESDLRKSVGGSKKASGNGMIEVVRAPPPVGREALQAMNIGTTQATSKIQSQSRGGAQAVGGGTTMTGTTLQKTAVKTGMFEVKAPGSVFDQKPPMAAGVDKSMEVGSSVIGTSMRPVQTSTPKQEQARARAPESRPQTQAGQAKGPLRSAMRNASPSPSPGPIAGSSGTRLREDLTTKSTTPPLSRPVGTQQLPPPIKGPLAQDVRTKSGQDKGKGKTVDVDDGGTTTDSESYETGNEYYSEEEEHIERVAVVSSPAMKVAPIANGHPVGYEPQHPKKTLSDVSHSTTSTLLVGPSSAGQKESTPTPVQRHPSIIAHASGSQTPRRRKSVRVSLQPTFSPPPPAIDYDYEEEQARYAPMSQASTTTRVRATAGEGSGYSRQPALPAPIPVRMPPTILNPKPRTTSTSMPMTKVDDVNDMWQDSGSDEDEEYTRAKRLLTRAAKREKDVSLLVANRA